VHVTIFTNPSSQQVTYSYDERRTWKRQSIIHAPAGTRPGSACFVGVRQCLPNMWSSGSLRALNMWWVPVVEPASATYGRVGLGAESASIKRDGRWNASARHKPSSVWPPDDGLTRLIIQWIIQRRLPDWKRLTSPAVWLYHDCMKLLGLVSFTDCDVLRANFQFAQRYYYYYYYVKKKSRQTRDIHWIEKWK